MTAKQHVRQTMADVLRARGKLGPYKEETVPKSTRYGGASNEYEPVASAPEPDTAADEVEELETEPAEAPAVEEELAAADEDSLVPPGEPYDTWLLAELKDECAAREVPTSGNKPDLIARLVAYDEVQV